MEAQEQVKMYGGLGTGKMYGGLGTGKMYGGLGTGKNVWRLRIR